MKLLRCPLNGLRNLDEFGYGGPVRGEPDAAPCSDRAWADYLFKEPNGAGVMREWWCHLPSGTWLIAERDTVTDRIVATFWPDALSDAAPGLGSDAVSDPGGGAR